jgi:two-component system cell cycle sensor histidine kinase/response regulator CckA
MPTDERRGNETILLVDDEPMVRSLIERILRGRGYTVLSAASPEEGLRLSREHDVDAIVTDVVMPSMSGPALVAELRRERPHLRALFISGYTSDVVVKVGLGEDEVAFVQKPFTAEVFASRLQQLLDA